MTLQKFAWHQLFFSLYFHVQKSNFCTSPAIRNAGNCTRSSVSRENSGNGVAQSIVPNRGDRLLSASFIGRCTSGTLIMSIHNSQRLLTKSWLSVLRVSLHWSLAITELIISNLWSLGRSGSVLCCNTTEVLMNNEITFTMLKIFSKNLLINWISN